MTITYTIKEVTDLIKSTNQASKQIYKEKFERLIDSLIQEIKQDPTISISQRNYAIKKMEELKGKL